MAHENHQLNDQTFNHYLENVRLFSEEIVKAESMHRNGKKSKIKANLMAQRIENKSNAPVMLKAIHNLCASGKRTLTRW